MTAKELMNKLYQDVDVFEFDKFAQMIGVDTPTLLNYVMNYAKVNEVA